LKLFGKKIKENSNLPLVIEYSCRFQMKRCTGIFAKNPIEILNSILE